MMCRGPYVKGSQAFPCGACEPCLFNRKRLWTHRIMLESALYADNCFLTLTYDDANVPVLSDGTATTLDPSHTRNFLKRLRKATPRSVRYYLVGEYGDQTQRPHYHAALFNFPVCRSQGTQYRNDAVSCCSVCKMVAATWGKGRVYLGTLETHSAQYISGYVVKKLTKKSDPRLDGRHPEFARMSLRPGLGADFMHEVASTILQYNLEDQADVPVSLAHGKRQFPLGRYLRRKLREKIGRDPSAPHLPLDEAMQTLWDNAVASTQNFPAALTQVYKNALIDADNQRVLNAKTRRQIFERKKRL